VEKFDKARDTGQFGVAFEEIKHSKEGNCMLIAMSSFLKAPGNFKNPQILPI